ncbi:phosphoethanolamine transferase [Aliarcobacter butzleri]|uniref:phosphoethanolamine transferase n=1 Tax=Aliarcobacter butzleri TaxID=28197 RepID=UPI0021B317C0|nr:phosphoethanolamine transferase [Aliarcobacter butzleri]MCT7554549.1 phosphoethanolamine transferase [Aliarcobacter butzleri]
MLNKSNKVNLFLGLILVGIWIGLYLVNLNNEFKIQNYQEIGKSQYLSKKINPIKNDITISFDFYINKLNEEPSEIKYENIFQTADLNNGLRIEFSRLKGNESNWALVYTQNNELKGIDLGLLPAKEEWHTFKLRYIKENGQLFIYLNNKIIKSLSDVNEDFNFDNVVAGHGFNEDRVFNGKIYNFKINDAYLTSKDYNLIYLISIIIILIMFKNVLKFVYLKTAFYTNGYFKKNNLDKYLIITVFIFIGIFYIVKYFNQIHLNDYSNINNPIELKKPLKIKTNFSIEFDFYIEPLANKVEGIKYENLFQTDDWNNGFRVELARKTESATLWGLVYTNKNGELKIVELGNIPSESKWNHFKMNYLKDENKIEISVNGININGHSNVNVNPKLDNIIVGKAFEDRNFNGKIKNFTIQKSYIPIYLYISICLISIFVFIFLLIKGIKEHHLENDTFSKKTVVFKSLCVLILLSFFSTFIYVTESYLVGENNVFRVIIAIFTIVAFIVIISFFQNLQSKIIKIPSLIFLYLSFYLYIYLYFTSAMYMVGKFSEQVRRPYGLSIDEIAAIYQSSFSESIQFIVTSLGYLHLGMIIVVPLILTIILYFSMRYIYPIKKHKTTLSYALGLIAAFYIILPSIPTYPKVIYAGFSRYTHQVDEMKKLYELRQKVDFNININNDMKGTHIIVIGESLNKEHMGSYGYFRETTPWLSKEKENQNFIFFQNSYAPYCHTVPSILKMITAANQYNGERQKEAISLIDIAKNAGFNTYWISEQQGAMIDTPLSVIIHESDEVKYVEEGGHIINALKNTMEKIDKQKNNLIFVHLMGSHADYKQRIIGYKDIFTDSKREEIGNYSDDKYKNFINNILNPYDTSVKYTDQLLEKIFNTTAKNNDFVDSFIFLSDHGEDVFEQKFHNSADFTYPMVRVPLIMYLSDRYKDKFKSDFNLLVNRKDNIFTNDLIYNTMLDILKLESDKFDHGYSLLDKNYIINESNALTMKKSPDEDDTYYTMTHERYIKDDPMYIAKKNVKFLNDNYPNKVLSVDNDLIAKLYQSNYYGFEGIEFNIALEKFQIGHYPEYMFKTTLEDYLDKSVINLQKKLWFDIKSPSGKDIGYSLSEFEKLDKKFNLKNRSWIESWEDGLDEFSNAGWKTLYYIQGQKYSGQKTDEVSYNRDSEERTKNYAKKIADKIIKNHIKGVSFFAEDYDFVKKELEPLLPKYISYHIFGFGYEYQIANPNMIDNIMNSNIFKDERVETILLDGPIRFKYRPEK